MGLFSNNKKLCPVCGNPTPRILPTKVEDMPICSECAGKLDMRADRLNKLTLNELNEYMTFYEENKPLKQEFKATYDKGAGFFSGKCFLADAVHHTFKTNRIENAIVYKPEHFVSLVISQDSRPVIELTRDRLVIRKTDAESRIEALRPAVDAYNEMVRMYEFNQRMNNNNNGNNNSRDNLPGFFPDVPFKKWTIDLKVDHPWGEGINDTDGQNWFSCDRPCINEALDNYRRNWNNFYEMAMSFKNAVCPEAAVIDENAGN